MKEELNLINQCIAGMPTAQKQLYNNYRNLWFTIALRYVNKREDALDVLQNALIKIYSKLDTYNAELGSFKSWSSKVVVNESLMFQRKYWVNNDLVDGNLAVVNESIDSEAISNLSMKDMVDMIKELPQGYKLIFNLYEIDGYSHKEIAEKLNISVGTSKSQLFKAKALLRKKMAPIYQGETKMIS